MLGVKIALTGAIMLAVLTSVIALVGRPMPSMPIALLLVAGWCCSASAVLIGLLMCAWE